MGINAAFSSWLRGAQSTATAALRAAQNYGAALQQQTMTAVSSAQRAALQPFQQQTQSTSRQGSTQAPYTARTTTSVDFIGGAARTIQGGVRGAQQAAQQIVRAHAPIVQGVQRDVSRAIQAAPGVIQSAPAAAQQAARQISAAHAPIVQGVQRDVGRAVQGAPAAVRSAPVAVQQGVQQIARAHSPIMQGVQRDAGRAIQSAPASARGAPAAIQQGVQQIARAHAPIIQGLQRDMGRVMGAVPAPLRDAAAFATQKKRDAQAELTRVAGPAASFEQGWTYPLYTWGQDVNKGYQGFVDVALPLYQRVQPLPNLPEVHSFQRGIAGSPGQLLEGLTFLPPAAERAGQLLWKEPKKLPGTAARFVGQQIEGLGAAYERDPYRLAGELVGTAALSYGLGAAAGAATRSAPKTPPGARSGSSGSPGGAGGRFKALEFGFQTKQIPKPQQETPKPFRLTEWQMERQKYARSQATVRAPAVPPQLQTTMRPATIPVPTPYMVYGSSGAAGFAAHRGSRATSAPSPQVALLDVAFATREDNRQDTLLNQETIQPERPAILDVAFATPEIYHQDTVLHLGTLHPVRPAILDQDFANRDEEMSALVLVPRMTRPQTQDQALVTVPRPTEDRKITDPPKRRRPPVTPLYLLPPRSSTPRGKDRKKREEEERRRRKKKGEADHWEYGPAPGLAEMGVMIFGSPRRSVLNLLPPGTSVLNLGGSPTPGGQPSFGFAARGPARPPVIPSFGPPSRGITGGSRTPAKPPAHAGENKKKRGKATKKKK